MGTRVVGDGARWVASGPGGPLGELARVRRPDGHTFLLPRGVGEEAWGPLLDAAIGGFRGTELFVEIDGADEGAGPRALAERGFVVHRCDHHYTVPTAEAGRPAPAGVGVVDAAAADPERLRLLDEELRRDVPGVGEWRNDPERFAAELRADPEFDPATFLLAVDLGTGAYLGLVRVWIRAAGPPRLGLVGVRRAARRRGLAGVLLSRVLAVLHRRGVAAVTAEVDEGNVGSNRLLRSFGARRTGGGVELVRRAGTADGSAHGAPAGLDQVE
ncbi:GNAT family N-acetyltransferase [Streptomyces profundus]|uniref:GNAT family N-acetyltransferase n=1 Tax=Streptomyces profundus TaxID=2867410 RepID=UPI001D1636FF|nr:GNAT family N-acetyltransferase [Streptomyces sp. MA3_2.13]UED87311.1 GNAT family N-acetyltransferase [Streptomyces sp. MA3_2.13]